MRVDMKVLLEEFNVVLGVECFYLLLCCFSWTVEVHVVMHAICKHKMVRQRQPVWFLHRQRPYITSTEYHGMAFALAVSMCVITTERERVQSGSCRHPRGGDTSRASTASEDASQRGKRCCLWLGSAERLVLEYAVVRCSRLFVVPDRRPSVALHRTHCSTNSTNGKKLCTGR
jgi:hypothetical protein